MKEGGREGMKEGENPLKAGGRKGGCEGGR